MPDAALTPDRPPRTGVQVIERAGAILRVVGAHAAGLTLAEIVERTGLAKSTVYRLLQALEGEQLLETSQGRYRIGAALAVSQPAAHEELRRRARPHLERLASRVHETVDLGILSGDSVLFIDQVRWERELAAGVIVGSLYPLHSCASGKALLAGDKDLAARVLGDPLAAATANTITDPARLRRELTKIAREGLAFDEEENHLGICGVATTVTAADGSTVSLGIPLPSVRYPERRQELAGVLRAAGTELAELL